MALGVMTVQQRFDNPREILGRLREDSIYIPSGTLRGRLAPLMRLHARRLGADLRYVTSAMPRSVARAGHCDLAPPGGRHRRARSSPVEREEQSFDVLPRMERTVPIGSIAPRDVAGDHPL